MLGSELVGSLLSAFDNWHETLHDTSVVPNALLFWTAAALGFLSILLWRAKHKPDVFLIEFTTFSSDDEAKKATHDKMRHCFDRRESFTQESKAFLNRLLPRTGVGQDTLMPAHLLTVPPRTDMEAAREEAKEVFTTILDELFAKTGVAPQEIDMLIVNCSLFCPTPSLAAMIINHYQMKSTIDSYNLGGMGCSAGVISIHLARKLLRDARRGAKCLVVSTENITQNYYPGNERGMLLPNLLFRMGGAAMLLTNSNTSSTCRCKYRLGHVVRVHLAARQDAYTAVYQEQDKAGVPGVRLSKGLTQVAGDALTKNLTRLGPLVLPLTEQLRFLWNMAQRRLLTRPKLAPYVPDFRRAFDHFCIHAGGRAVIDAIQSHLRLSDSDVQASREALRTSGNTSSASIWYELRWLEQHGRVKRGHCIVQLAFGSGFKCNSATWHAC